MRHAPNIIVIIICHIINVQYNHIMVTRYKDMQYIQTNNSICIHRIQICSGYYICVHVCGQNPAVCGLTAWKSPVSVIYCLHGKFNRWIRGYARWFIQGKKFRSILLIGREKAFGKLYYGKPHLVYMQCSYAILMNTEHQHDTAAQTYNIATSTVCTEQYLVCTHIMCFVELYSCELCRLWALECG